MAVSKIILILALSNLKQINMKVKDLIEELKMIENQDSEIALKGNLGGNPEDEEMDISFDELELWDDGSDTITLFVYQEQKESEEN